MNVQEQIKKYITSQPEPKRSDMQERTCSHFKRYRSVNYGSDGKNSKNQIDLG
jgi:hypothetical protein